MGTELSPDALELFVADLSHLSDAKIKRGLERCRREVKGSNGFAPRLVLQDVLDRAGVVTEGEAQTIEADQAWDLVIHTANRFARADSSGELTLRRIVSKPLASCITCSGEGMYHSVCNGVRWVHDCPCKRVAEVPGLSDRVVDVVRRMGGWATFKDIKQASYPFVRRDFLLEYAKHVKAESWHQRGEHSARLAAGDNTFDEREALLSKILASPVR